MPVIPTTASEISPEWLAEVTGLPITGASLEQIGVGIGVSSAVYRVTCDGHDCPKSLVVKLPALDDAATFTATVLRLYIREVRFFEELAARSPIRVPACHHAAVDEETSQFVVVMEDMGALRMVDQNDGMSVADARASVTELAAWHATWWGDADPIAERGSAVSLADPIYPAVLPLVFAEGWDKLTAGMTVAEPIMVVGPRWAEAMPRLLSELAATPSTLIHGDFRADNILFDPDGKIVLLDFQLTGVGRGVFDLAYFVTQSLAPEVASEHEGALFDNYVSALESHGVTDSTDQLWEDYRKAALFCLVYPVVASRGMDLEDPRQYQLLDNMNTRFARAVDELALADLL